MRRQTRRRKHSLLGRASQDSLTGSLTLRLEMKAAAATLCFKDGLPPSLILMASHSEHKPFHFERRAALWVILSSWCVSTWRSLQSYQRRFIISLNWEQFPESGTQRLLVIISTLTAFVSHLISEKIALHLLTRLHFVCFLTWKWAEIYQNYGETGRNFGINRQNM